MTKPVGWTLCKPPPLKSLTSATQPKSGNTASPFGTTPEVQARILTALTNDNSPEDYIPHLKSFNDSGNAAWPKFVAACLTPSPCAQLEPSKEVVKCLKPPDGPTELLPEPQRGMAYQPPPCGYRVKVPETVVETRERHVHVPVVRRPAMEDVIRLGTGMQPTLSRRRSGGMVQTSLPNVRSMFLSGRKSEKVRAAEEREREREKEIEKEKEAAAERDAHTASGAVNGGRASGAELLDLDLDFTVEDAAEFEPVEGMDDNMLRTQRDKEARPRHVGEIVKKMHNTAAGIRNVVETESNLPEPSDTGYARKIRREENAKKRQEMAEAAKEKERILAEQRRDRFNRKRKRKLRKAGKFVHESEDEETAVPETEPSPPKETTSNSTAVLDISNPDYPDGRTTQRRRIDGPPETSDEQRPSDDRYRGQPYDERRRHDAGQGHHHPPHDPRRHDSRSPSDWSAPQHPYHPPPPPSGHFAPPSPYYAPPSPYYPSYHPPPPYYPHHHPPPPPQYYSHPRAPPRLSREEFDKRRDELYSKIGGFCRNLQPDDARAIDDFLDNQDYMFRPTERTRYIVLEQTREEEVLLRIDRETRRWEIVRKRER